MESVSGWWGRHDVSKCCLFSQNTGQRFFPFRKPAAYPFGTPGKQGRGPLLFGYCLVFISGDFLSFCSSPGCRGPGSLRWPLLLPANGAPSKWSQTGNASRAGHGGVETVSPGDRLISLKVPHSLDLQLLICSEFFFPLWLRRWSHLPKYILDSWDSLRESPCLPLSVSSWDKSEYSLGLGLGLSTGIYQEAAKEMFYWLN